MHTYTTGCLICGKPLTYFNPATVFSCKICGHKAEANAACEDGHYICDQCHAQDGYTYITNYTIEAKVKNPILIATDLMKNKLINMHGPEHHYLVVAALLSAYKNAGGKIELTECLQLARQRAKNVPGGICGLWGSCGAAIGAGIFISVVTSATPLSEQEWSLANLMTSQCLADISRNGGPRCCKRNTYISLLRAIMFIKEHLDIEMEAANRVDCTFFYRNNSCRKESCLFYPKI